MWIWGLDVQGALLLVCSAADSAFECRRVVSVWCVGRLCGSMLQALQGAQALSGLWCVGFQTMHGAF